MLRVGQKRLSGFLEKSRLIPSQFFEWLGLVWDTRATQFAIPPPKRVAVRRTSGFFWHTRGYQDGTSRECSGSPTRLHRRYRGKTILKPMTILLLNHARKGLRDEIQPVPQVLRASFTDGLGQMPWTLSSSEASSCISSHPCSRISHGVRHLLFGYQDAVRIVVTFVHQALF